MCIDNQTKGTRVIPHLCYATTFWQRLTGLLGTQSLPQGHGLLIKPCSSVHTFGMAYPIDVLFVDREHRIIKVVVGLSAGRVALAKGSDYVVELPIGTVEQTLCAVGDIIHCT